MKKIENPEYLKSNCKERNNRLKAVVSFAALVLWIVALGMAIIYG